MGIPLVDLGQSRHRECGFLSIECSPMSKGISQGGSRQMEKIESLGTPEKKGILAPQDFA